MKNSIVLLLLLLFFTSQVFAGWMASADYSSCPRKYFPNSSASEGPFNLESECLAKVREVESSQNVSCARYSCVNQSPGSSDSAGSAAAGHQMDTHIGNAISAGISGDISGADAVGLVGLGLLGNALLSPSTPAAPQRQKTPQELEAERVAAEKYAIELARREREREEKRDARIAPMFALLDPLPSGQASQNNSEKSNYYTKGFEHASQCISQNAGVACAGVSNDQQSACLADYRAGYDTGNKQKIFSMKEAYQAGMGAGQRGELANGASDQRASGPCRTDWLQSYNQGFFKGKNGKLGK